MIFSFGKIWGGGEGQTKCACCYPRAEIHGKAIGRVFTNVNITDCENENCIMVPILISGTFGKKGRLITKKSAFRQQKKTLFSGQMDFQSRFGWGVILLSFFYTLLIMHIYEAYVILEVSYYFNV